MEPCSDQRSGGRGALIRFAYGRRGAGWLFCCLVCLAHTANLFSLGTGKPLREYGRQAWQSDSGLPQNTVRAITQTRDGFLWIATEAGLVRFDGIDFAVFDTENTPALHSGVITSLVEDAAGTLWIGTTNGLVSERGGVFTVVEELPSPSVLAMFLTHRGQLLVMTPAGAAVLAKDRFVEIAGTSDLGFSESASLAAEDAQGHLWMAGQQRAAAIDTAHYRVSTHITAGQIGELQAIAVEADGSLWIGGADGIANSSGMKTIAAIDVTCLLAAPDGSMWIGGSKGLSLSLHGVIRAIPELAGEHVQRLFLDRADTLWVATSEGLARIRNGRVERAARNATVAGVLAIFEDREGSMWFGTDTNGLHVLRDQTFSTLTTEDGLSANLVRAVFEDHAGTMWIGTSGGGLDSVVAGRAAEFKGALPSKVVLALAETRTGARDDLWVATPEGLARIENRGQRITTFTTADGLADDFVRSLYADRDGSLWIGTRNGLSHYKDGNFRSYSTLDGLPSDLVGTILRRGNGELWVGTLDGLSRMVGDGFVAAPAPRGAVTAMLEDAQGSLWVGIHEHGLSRLRGTDAISFAASNLPATIYGMLEDANGDLWLSSRKGVARVSVAALDAFAAQGGKLKVVQYGSADGMRISEASGGGHPAAWRAHDGGLWFATLDGVAVVYPRTGPRYPTPPLTAIEQVLIDDQPVPQALDGSAIRVQPGRGRFSIKYAGLSFIAPQSVRYQYMLEGFEKNWVDAGVRRTAFYTNVPPGKYRFLVRAANSDGLWSLAPAAQAFVVQPYFYQTIWFYALLAAALAALGYFIYRWRVLTVEAQYRAVIEERSRIAREIHDTLAQGYVAIAVQLELAEHLICVSAESAAQQLKQTKEMVREGLAEARSSIWNLRAQSDAETLPSLLATYVAAAVRRHAAGPVIKFAVHGAYRPLERGVEKELERIAQQAVANAIAHAKARSVVITLNYDSHWLDLRVADDGIGMAAGAGTQEKRGHFGIRGMRERAEGIGAVLQVESTPGRGVIITVRIDFEKARGKETH